jgi:nitroreductase
MKDAIATIHERISTNQYDPSKTMTEDEIRQIIADATEAPSSYNIQHWRFVAVTDPARKQTLRQASYDQPKVSEAAATIIVLGDLRAHERLAEIYQPMVDAGIVDKAAQEMIVQRASGTYASNPQFAHDEAIRSGALAAMTLMIAAQARGYFTGPMIGFDPQAVKKAFHIAERYLPVMLVTVGHPAPGNWPRKPRLAVNEVLAFNDGGKFPA